MGLDNGFCVKSKKRKITRDMLPDIINYPFEKDYDGDIEIVYFRKCWGIRNGVLDILGKRFSNADEYFFEIDKPEQVLDIIGLLSYFLDPNRWEDEGDSIWSFEEIRAQLIVSIINLAAIEIFMKENPDVYLEFYDSY